MPKPPLEPIGRLRNGWSEPPQNTSQNHSLSSILTLPTLAIGTSIREHCCRVPCLQFFFLWQFRKLHLPLRDSPAIPADGDEGLVVAGPSDVGNGIRETPTVHMLRAFCQAGVMVQFDVALLGSDSKCIVLVCFVCGVDIVAI